MGRLRDYEKKVISILTKDVLPQDVVDAVTMTGELVSYEYTGAGYFLTLRHSCLPSERIVCNEPMVLGKAGGIDTGFVVFLENKQLMLDAIHGATMPFQNRTGTRMLKSLQPNSALVSDAKVPPIALSRLDSIAVGLIFAALAAFAAFALSDKPSVRAWRTHCLYAIGAGVVLLWGLRFFAIGV